MLHAREDYNRIQDPLNKIGEDEPVFLLRAKDKFAPDVVDEWADRVASHDIELAVSIHKFADHMRAWQKENGCKIPDTPDDKQWEK